MPECSNTIAIEKVADMVKDHIKPTIMDLDTPEPTKAKILILPKELNAIPIKSFLDDFRDHPERRKGTMLAKDLDSLIAYINRFKNTDSVVFANPVMQAATITGIIDYHEAVNEFAENGGYVVNENPLPKFCQHRTHYAFPLSDEWKAWNGLSGKWMDQAEFAEMLEDRIGDVVSPPDGVNAPKEGDKPAENSLKHLAELLGGNFATPTKLMELSRGLAVHVGETVSSAVNLATGEGEIQYLEKHSDAKGQPLKVPNLFLIAIPVCLNGPLYQLAVRLRYRAKAGTISWCCQLYRPEKTFEHAFDEACKTVITGTGLPLFMGEPER